MYKLLSSQHQRFYLIIEMLLENNNRIEVGKITETLSIEKRTLDKDINVLASLINPVSLEIKNSFVVLDIPNNCNTKFLYQCILEDSIEIKILELVILKRFYIIDDLAEDLGISTSTLRRKINHINRGMKKYQLKIKIDVGEIAVKGNRTDFLSFYLGLFEEKYDFVLDWIPLNQYKAIETIINKIEFFNSLASTLRRKQAIIAWSHVCILYYKFNSSKDPYKFSAEYVDDITVTLVERVYNISISKSVLNTLIQLFLDKIYSLNLSIEEVQSKMDESKLVLFTAINSIVEEIIDYYDLKVSNIESRVINIYNNLNQYLYRKTVLYDCSRNFIRELRKFDLSLLKEIYLIISNNQDYVFDGEELAVLIYCITNEWDRFSDFLISRLEVLKVAIIDDQLYGTPTFEKSVIEFELGRKVLIDILEVESRQNLDNILSKYDVIVTGAVSISKYPENVIAVNEFPSLKNILKLREYFFTKTRKND